VADTGNARIQKFNRDGQFLMAWNGADAGQLKNPVALAIDSRNNVYVMDENGNESQVRKFDGNGVSLLSWSVRSTDTEILNPVDIGLDAQDRLYHQQHHQRPADIRSRED
jgi:DNA-binding beta-propeller fold protein YncE